jgi:hypothetical protein
MSPEYQGEPVPSMMCPLVMTRSKGRSAAKARVVRISKKAGVRQRVAVM